MDMKLICIWSIFNGKNRFISFANTRVKLHFQVPFEFLNQNLIKKTWYIIYPKRFWAKNYQTNLDSKILLVQKKFGSKKRGRLCKGSRSLFGHHFLSFLRRVLIFLYCGRNGCFFDMIWVTKPQATPLLKMAKNGIFWLKMAILDDFAIFS